MNTDDVINQVTDDIIDKINPSWNKLQKIRFVYLELGSYLEKNTDFFLHDKLANFALTDEERNEIYFKDKLYETKHPNQKTQYQVVCKSAALFLKNAYDKLGIESLPISTVGNDDEIKHWFIICKDDEGKQYFLTLAADLPFIKNNLPTEHFANNIIFADKNDDAKYDIPENSSFSLGLHTYLLDDGRSLNVREFNHTILSLKELEELDRSIGYGRLYVLRDFFRDIHRSDDSIDIDADLSKAFNDVFVGLSLSNSKLFESFSKSLGFNREEAALNQNITSSQVDALKNNLDNYLEKYLTEKTDFVTDSNDIIRSSVVSILERAGVTDIPSNISYSDLLKIYSKKLRSLKKHSKESDTLQVIQGIMIVKSRFDDFLNLRREYENNSFDEDIKARYIKTQENISLKKLNPLMEKIVLITDREKVEFPGNHYASLEYVVNKFKTLFPVVFDCNFKSSDDSESIKTENQTNFSVQSYSEQKVIVDLMLERMFPELNNANCCEIENYDSNYSPVKNRIRTYPIRDKETGEYCMAFDFGAKAEENSVEYVYIPSSNLLRKRNPLKEKDKYFIVSNHFNKELEKMEEDIIGSQSSGVRK